MYETMTVLGVVFFVILCVYVGVPLIAQSFVWWMRFAIKLREIRAQRSTNAKADPDGTIPHTREGHH